MSIVKEIGDRCTFTNGDENWSPQVEVRPSLFYWRQKGDKILVIKANDQCIQVSLETLQEIISWAEGK